MDWGLIIAGVGAVISIIVSWYSIALKRAEIKKLETELTDRSIEYDTHFKVLTGVMAEIQKSIYGIFKDSKADRFLILEAATNGSDSFKYATCVFEMHRYHLSNNHSIGAVDRYKGFEFDDVYRKMLEEVELRGSLYYDVPNMPEGDLKHIYQVEGVKGSIIFFGVKFEVNKKTKMIYSSIATHDEAGFTPAELTMLAAYQDQINSILKKYFES